MNTNIAILGVLVLLIGAFLFIQSGTNNTYSQEVSEVKTYTVDEVAKHNSPDDCWLVIHGKVYDVTSFIPQHPGGDIITQYCGKDATEVFENRPGSGTPHSDTARQLLENYYIGELKG